MARNGLSVRLKRPRQARVQGNRMLVLFVLATTLLGACSSGSGQGRTPARSSLPTVDGTYGSKPALEFLGATASKTLKSEVLRTGTGRAVKNGDLLVVDYLGQIWRGPVFDNSYERGFPTGLVIGRGKAITGWDDVLVGVHVGSRVVMSVPPDKGYGASGNKRAGIKANDTLVFVVDVVAAYNSAARGDTRAAASPVATPGVSISGALGAAPALIMRSGAKAPVRATLSVLAKGLGAPVTPGLLVVQYVARRYGGAGLSSTYARGTPAAVTVTNRHAGRPFDLLRGVPTGSRVLLEVPGARGRAAVAMVVDVVAQPRPAAVTS